MESLRESLQEQAEKAKYAIVCIALEICHCTLAVVVDIIITRVLEVMEGIMTEV
jgi:hypothetical protein